MIIKFIFGSLKDNLFKCVFVQQERFYDSVYGSEVCAEVASRANLLGERIDPEAMAERSNDLAQAELVFTGWGAPQIGVLLRACPQLKVIFFAGGTTNYMLDPELWERGIVISSSYAANAVPVAEYTLASILFGLKGAWRAMAEFKLQRQYQRRTDVIGAYGAKVGLISCGATARELLRLLRGFDVQPLVYDPFISENEVRHLGAEPASLEEIFQECEIVSLHAPELEETRGMITGRHLEMMRPGGTFINTARGSIVREAELCEVARLRPDLQFVLDVVCPEPPAADSPLFEIPNIFVTPHLAGAMGQECRRMGQYMLEELDRYLKGEPLQWVITPSLAARSIHRPHYMRDAIPAARV